MYASQKKIKKNRIAKYKISREIGFDVETSKKIRDYRTRNFIKFCYFKLNKTRGANNE